MSSEFKIFLWKYSYSGKMVLLKSNSDHKVTFRLRAIGQAEVNTEKSYEKCAKIDKSYSVLYL